jgi:phage shock protein PspC (stress-responsive transcriptional regulator)
MRMENKVLKKSKDKRIAGICGGIADFFGWKSINVRMIFLAITLLGGSGLIAYIILYFVMPQDNTNTLDSFNLENFRS